MTGSDLFDWKRHPVTELVFAHLEQRYRDMLEEIGKNRELGLDDLRFAQGYLAGIQDVLNVDAEDTANV